VAVVIGVAAERAVIAALRCDAARARYQPSVPGQALAVAIWAHRERDLRPRVERERG
jgi:hypothetical protein